jgi:hypothetical protein
MQRILQKAMASAAPSGPKARFCLPFLHFACRQILQNEFRKQTILLQSFTVVYSLLLDASNRAWYHLVAF